MQIHTLLTGYLKKKNLSERRDMYDIHLLELTSDSTVVRRVQIHCEQVFVSFMHSLSISDVNQTILNG